MTLRSSVIAALNRRSTTRNAIEWWVHRQTQVYILSYPKCGRTWLRLMIGKALDEQFQLGMSNPMELGRMHHLRDAIPRIRISHEDSYVASTIDTDKQRFAGKTIVFLVRDPRDVVVSMYFEATRRRDLFQGDLATFIRQRVGGLDAILDYYNLWAEARTIPGRFELVRYEELHADPAATLRRVLATMQLAVSEAAIEVAIGFSKFDNMRKLEKANTFKSERLRPGRDGDAESFKTRKGKIGGYLDYMTAEDLAYVERRLAERLSPYFADYRRAPDQLGA